MWSRLLGSVMPDNGKMSWICWAWWPGGIHVSRSRLCRAKTHPRYSKNLIIIKVHVNTLTTNEKSLNTKACMPLNLIHPECSLYAYTEQCPNVTPMGLIEDCIHTPASPEAVWGPLSPPPCWGIPVASETSSPLLPAGWTWAPEDVAALWATRSDPTLRRQTALLAEEEEKKWVTVFTLCYNQKGLKHTAWLWQTLDHRLSQTHACSRETSPWTGQFSGWQVSACQTAKPSASSQSPSSTWHPEGHTRLGLPEDYTADYLQTEVFTHFLPDFGAIQSTELVIKHYV